MDMSKKHLANKIRHSYVKEINAIVRIYSIYKQLKPNSYE